MNNGARPEKIRAFVAIYPPAEIVAQLEKIQAHLRKAVDPESVRWTTPGQIHLTLQFLGSITQEQLAKFESALELVTSGIKTLPLRVGTAGVFPGNKRPRIIWTGIFEEIDSLQKLKQKLDDAFAGLGYVSEKRKFHPHLTLGRVSDLRPAEVRRLAREIFQFQSTQFGEWNVGKILLMQSVLSPKGSSYRILKSFPLKSF